MLKDITIIVPSFQHLNYFGTSRKSSVSWKRFDLLCPTTSILSKHWIHSIMARADLVLFSGTLPGLNSLTTLTPHSTNVTSILPHFCCL
jgi:hypothetical protein